MSLLSRRIVSLKLPASVLVERSDELLDICKQCGTIHQYVLDLTRDQLLIEVEEFSAMRLLNEFKRAPPELGGHAIRVTSTSRQEMIRAQAESSPLWTPAERKAREFKPSRLRAEDGTVSAVVCGHVDKETAEVKHDILRKAFAKYGRVVCLTSFRHKNTLHCLVQYSDAASAGEAVRKLNDMCIYDECCILRVYYSNISSLMFKDDGRGYKKLIHHDSHLELSRKTVDHLQVWNPNKSECRKIMKQVLTAFPFDVVNEVFATEHNKTKDPPSKATHNKKGIMSLDKIPKIPKFSAINSKQNMSRQSPNAHDSGNPGSHVAKSSKTSQLDCGTNATAKSKSIKPSQRTSKSSSDMPKGNHKVNHVPVTSTSSIPGQLQSSSGKAPTLKGKRLPSRVGGCDNLSQRDECITTDTVKTTVSTSSSKDKASTKDDTRTAVRPSTLDITAFTLSLDPSDCSDIDTDGSASSGYDSSRKLTDLVHRPSPVSYHGVGTAVGCQEIILPSTGIQCCMEDDELEKLVMLCKEQMAELKKKCADVAEKESCNAELLLENANLKKLLDEVQSELRQLKEIVNNSSVGSKVDASTQVDFDTQRSTVQEEAQKVAFVVKCDKAQQTDKLCSKHLTGSTSRNSYKRSSSYSDCEQDTTYEPFKKKQKKKGKSSSSSSSTSSSSSVSPVRNVEKTSDGYALKIRNKFLQTHVQSFLKSQKFIKAKLDMMKEAMKSCNADMHKYMNKMVPQFENMYAMTVKLAELEGSNEEGLFSCTTELSTIFPSLIASLNESLSMKVPGVTQTILNVLSKMEHLVMEMNKYSPQSKTLAYGNANTGETTSVESSSSSGGCNTANNSTPPPLLSLDEAVEMLDEHQRLGSNDSLECVSSLTVSISTKFLQRIDRKQLSAASEDGTSTDETTVTACGAPSSDGGKVQIEENKNQNEDEATSVEDSHDDVFTVHSPGGNEPIVIEVVQNNHYSTKSEEATGKTRVSKDDDSVTALASSEDINLSCDTVSVGCEVLDGRSSNRTITNSAPAPSTTCIPQITAATLAYSANQNTNNRNTSVATSTSAVTTPAFGPFQDCTGNTVQNSAPPTYNASRNYLYSQPSTATGGFTPLLQQSYIPTPIINISQSIDGVVVKWTLDHLDIHLASQVHSYCLRVFQGDSAPPPDMWHTIGEVLAMKLPMACTLKYFEKGMMYHFAVQAINGDGVRGQFSKPKTIQILC